MEKERDIEFRVATFRASHQRRLLNCLQSTVRKRQEISPSESGECHRKVVEQRQAGAIKRQLNRGVGVYRCLSPHSTAMTEAEGTPDGYDRVAVD